MDRRSTNVKGFVHFGGDVQSGVEDGIGVRLGTASTGSTVWVSAISDDTNANIGIRGQGSGGVTIGAGNPIKGCYSTTFAWTLAAVSSGQSGVVTISTSVGDVNPADGDLVQVSLGDISAYVGLTVQALRYSTVASSRVSVIVGNISSTATSTASGTGRISWIDLT